MEMSAAEQLSNAWWGITADLLGISSGASYLNLHILNYQPSNGPPDAPTHQKWPKGKGPGNNIDVYFPALELCLLHTLEQIQLSHAKLIGAIRHSSSQMKAAHLDKYDYIYVTVHVTHSSDNKVGHFHPSFPPLLII